MVHFYLAWVKDGSTYVACGTFEKNHFFSQVTSSLPVFVTESRLFIREKAFSLDAILFYLTYLVRCRGCARIVPRIFWLCTVGILMLCVLVWKVLILPNRCITVGMLILYFRPSQCAYVQNISVASLSKYC